MNAYPEAYQPALVAIWKRCSRHSAPLPRAEVETWKAGEPFHKIVAAIASQNPAAAALRHMQWAKDANLPELYERAKTLYSDIMHASKAKNPALRRWRNLSELERLQTERLRHEWMTDPDTIRGEEVRAAASKGGRCRAKQAGIAAQGPAMQSELDALHKKHPDWSYEELKRHISKRHGFSMASLKRYTRNPKKRTGSK